MFSSMCQENYVILSENLINGNGLWRLTRRCSPLKVACRCTEIRWSLSNVYPLVIMFSSNSFAWFYFPINSAMKLFDQKKIKYVLHLNWCTTFILILKLLDINCQHLRNSVRDIALCNAFMTFQRARVLDSLSYGLSKGKGCIADEAKL